MKKLFYITILLLSTMSFAQKTVKSENARYSPLFNLTFSVQSDFVSESNGCYTINVRVYLHSSVLDGQVFLVANQNVQVGDGCNTNRTSIEVPNGCPSGYFNGDYIIESKDNFRYCLKELLTDSVIYGEYKYIVSKVIEKR